jgi:hypothetical protein
LGCENVRWMKLAQDYDQWCWTLIFCAWRFGFDVVCWCYDGHYVLFCACLVGTLVLNLMRILMATTSYCLVGTLVLNLIRIPSLRHRKCGNYQGHRMVWDAQRLQDPTVDVQLHAQNKGRSL